MTEAQISFLRALCNEMLARAENPAFKATKFDDKNSVLRQLQSIAREKLAMIESGDFTKLGASNAITIAKEDNARARRLGF